MACGRRAIPRERLRAAPRELSGGSRADRLVVPERYSLGGDTAVERPQVLREDSSSRWLGLDSSHWVVVALAVEGTAAEAVGRWDRCREDSLQRQGCTHRNTSGVDTVSARFERRGWEPLGHSLSRETHPSKESHPWMGILGSLGSRRHLVRRLAAPSRALEPERSPIRFPARAGPR
jgi:hypothetical protein